MVLADQLKRVDSLMALADAALASVWQNRSGQRFLKEEPVAEFRVAGLSFLGTLFPPGHIYVTDFASQSSKSWVSTIEGCKGILRALRSDLEGGWLTSTRGLIAAAIFSDFVEMAEHLLDEGYKDAAAVLGGGALEQRLRELATRSSVDTTHLRDGKDVARKADALNADLVRAGAYTVLVGKSVTAWLGLRNKAAHAEYDQYTKEQVGIFLDGIRHFLLTTA